MIRNITLIIYSVFLVALAIGSTIVVYANDTPPILILELVVDITLIIGVILYIKNYSFNWWRVFFVGALMGECYLLFIESALDTVDVIIWGLVLLPAFVLNSSVAGLTRQIQPTQKPRG